MRVTKHFQERWAERMLGVPKVYLEEYIQLNEERMLNQIATCFHTATYQGAHRTPKSERCHYYQNDNVTLVVNKEQSALVTVYVQEERLNAIK